MLALAVLSTVFSIVGPKLQGKVTTKLFEGLTAKYAASMLGQPMPSLDFPYMEKILLLVIGLYLISTMLSYLQQIVMSDVAQKIVYDMREDVNKKLHKLPLKYYDARTHGEIMSRVTNDIDNIGNTLQQSLTQFITSTCTIVGVLVMMLTISPLLTLISMLTLPAAFLATNEHFEKIAGACSRRPAERTRFSQRAYRGNVFGIQNRQSFQPRG